MSIINAIPFGNPFASRPQGIISGAMDRLPTAPQSYYVPEELTRPSYNLSWDFSGDTPQLVDNRPSYGGGDDWRNRYTNYNYRYIPPKLGSDEAAQEPAGPAIRRPLLDQSSDGDNSDTFANLPSYGNTAERDAWFKSARDAGYSTFGLPGSLENAQAQAREGNPKAIQALKNFLGSGEAGSTLKNNNLFSSGIFKGLGDLVSNILPPSGTSAIPSNLTNSVQALQDSGNLYSSDNSSGYTGDTLQQQQNISDAAATSTYGDWSSWDDSSSSDDNNNNDSGSSIDSSSSSFSDDGFGGWT